MTIVGPHSIGRDVAVAHSCRTSNTNVSLGAYSQLCTTRVAARARVRVAWKHFVD